MSSRWLQLARPLGVIAVATLLLVATPVCCAQQRQVAITIDDLPRGGDGGPYDPAALAAMTNKLLAPFRQRGYRFVTLTEALKDPAYQSTEEYVGRGGFSWIHRWSMAKHLPSKGEPDPPAWAQQAYDALPH